MASEQCGRGLGGVVMCGLAVLGLSLGCGGVGGPEAAGDWPSIELPDSVPPAPVGDVHTELLQGWARGDACESGGPLCDVLAAAKGSPTPRQNRVRVGITLECVDPIRTSWRSELSRALRGDLEGLEPGLMGLHIGAGQARLFTIVGEDPQEEVGVRAAAERVKGCITEGCRRVVLDDDLADFLDQGHSAVRVPDVDEAGHLVGSAPGTLPITITRARVEGGTWWLVAETKARDDRQCQYLSVFPDVPTVSRPRVQQARASR